MGIAVEAAETAGVSRIVTIGDDYEDWLVSGYDGVIGSVFMVVLSVTWIVVSLARRRRHG